MRWGTMQGGTCTHQQLTSRLLVPRDEHQPHMLLLIAGAIAAAQQYLDQGLSFAAAMHCRSRHVLLMALRIQAPAPYEHRRRTCR